MKNTLVLLCSLLSLAFAQDCTQLSGYYVAPDSRECYVVNVFSKDSVRVHRLHNGNASEFAFSDHTKILNVDDEGRMRIAYALTDTFELVHTTIPQLNMYKGRDYVAYKRLSASTEVKNLWDYAQRDIPGSYRDTERGEVFVFNAKGDKLTLHYSNGRDKFIEVKILKVNEKDLSIRFQNPDNKSKELTAEFFYGGDNYWTVQIRKNRSMTFVRVSDNVDVSKYPNQLNIPSFDYPSPADDQPAYKPVTYLYPEQAMPVKVTLAEDIPLMVTYPKYPKGGWEVTATPDGQITDAAGNEYSYLFWDTHPMHFGWDMSMGAVVSEPEVLPYLENTLKSMNLTAAERNEFIVYWLPILAQHKYVQINWAVQYQQNGKDLSNANGRVYERAAGMTINPAPHTLYRVMMVYKPMTRKITLPGQDIPALDRKGFTVVEWGGTKAGKTLVEK